MKRKIRQKMHHWFFKITGLWKEYPKMSFDTKMQFSTALLTCISLLIAYESLLIANKSFYYSVNQNKKDSDHSDSIFNIQKRNMDLQLKNTQEQLIEFKKLTKPRLSINEFYVTSLGVEKNASEIYGELKMKNVGNREAQNLNYKSFLILSDFSNISDLSEGKIKNELNSEESYILKVKLKSHFKVPWNNYYIYFVIYYTDNELIKKDSLEYYSRQIDYSPDGNTNTNCSQDEINNIKRLIRQKSILESISQNNIKKEIKRTY